MTTNVLIMGAAGRDFHNFNVLYRDNPNFNVIAFTATQIPDINGRVYPKELAGKRYPRGIPIYDEKDLRELIHEHDIQKVLFSYSDVSHEYVMHKASLVNSLGAEFALAGSETMLKSNKPVVSICAVRTGSGKSQTTRKVAEVLKQKEKKIAVIRHPMPYGDLVKQRVQKFESYEDLDKNECTIEEREEYEPHIDAGNIVFAGVDYEAILREAEKCADVILWDGGNNDFSFYKTDLYITVADPLRPKDLSTYYPGETNILLADVVVINKENNATKEEIDETVNGIKKLNPAAEIIHANSVLSFSKNEIKGKKVLVIEDGPTTTHGGMSYGAGFIAAKDSEVIDPRPFAVGSIKKTFEKFRHLRSVLPAMGYGEQQVRELEETINNADCDLVVSGTPIDLNRILKVNKPIIRVKYDLDDNGKLLKIISRMKRL